MIKQWLYTLGEKTHKTGNFSKEFEDTVKWKYSNCYEKKKLSDGLKVQMGSQRNQSLELNIE